MQANLSVESLTGLSFAGEIYIHTTLNIISPTTLSHSFIH